MYTGPKLTNEDLVFGYDTGYGVADNATATRFYLGEDTINLVPLSTFNNTSNWAGGGWSGSMAASTEYDNTLELTVTNGWRTFAIDHGVTSGGTISVSFEYKLKSQQTTGIFGLVLNGLNLGNYHNNLGNISNADLETGVWKTYNGSFTANSNTYGSKICIGLRGNDGGGLTDVLSIRKLQVEQKTNATPYTETSRSSTASLIDLAKTTDIDVSNVSFDSTGQPEFDGTNDYLDLGADVTFKGNGGDWTSEHIVKYDVVPAGYNNSTSPGNFLGGTVNYNSWYWSVLNSKLALWNRSPGVWKYGSTTLVANKFYHVVLVCEPGGTSYKMYLNGVEEGGTNASYVYNASHSGISARYFGVGYAPGTRTVNGKIPVTKIYDRALSAQEIKDNFNAYKNRFDI